MNDQPETDLTTEHVDGCRRFAATGLDFVPLEVETPGEALTANVTGEGAAPTLGAGVATFQDIDFEWTHPCDEAVYVVSGELVVTSSNGTVVGRPGDMMFMTKGAQLRYRTSGLCRVYAAMNLSPAHLEGVDND